jgi:DNA-binding LytR/AlgR family response regulator
VRRNYQDGWRSALKIIIEKPQSGEEEQIIVKCHNISPELMNMLNAIKVQGSLLIAFIGNEIHRVAPSDVFYIETVDNKTFLYCESNVYEIKQKLYELEELKISDFLRISKSTIVNLSKIKSLIPSMSGRLEAVLSNGERVVISRQYVSELKKNLGM